LVNTPRARSRFNDGSTLGNRQPGCRHVPATLWRWSLLAERWSGALGTGGWLLEITERGWLPTKEPSTGANMHTHRGVTRSWSARQGPVIAPPRYPEDSPCGRHVRRGGALGKAEDQAPLTTPLKSECKGGGGSYRVKWGVRLPQEWSGSRRTGVHMAADDITWYPS
jgi:hypothetical protein